MAAAVLLVDPKFPHNVGNALRACALLDAHVLAWTGLRPTAARCVRGTDRRFSWRSLRV